jgi:undecaprenyl-diphosphatase
VLSALHALLLGIVEGLTEFVPVSSTGHLIVVDRWLGHQGAGAEAFEIVIQLGALAACVIYYRRLLWATLRGVVRGEREAQRLAVAIASGFVPTAAVGYLFHHRIEEHLFGPRPVGLALVVGGGVMIVVDLWRRRARASSIQDLRAVRARHGLVVGVVQCAALWPGTSRSMAAIVGGQLSGLSTRVAADFAFLVGIPTLGAACLFKLVKARHALANEVGATAVAIGLAVSFVVGWAVIAAFLRYLRKTGLVPFGLYRIAVGAFVLWALA